MDWLWSNFPNERRFASMIFVADDVLTPEVVQAMFRIRYLCIMYIVDFNFVILHNCSYF
jgi:hypothetical protein